MTKLNKLVKVRIKNKKKNIYLLFKFREINEVYWQFLFHYKREVGFIYSCGLFMIYNRELQSFYIRLELSIK